VHLICERPVTFRTELQGSLENQCGTSGEVCTEPVITSVAVDDITEILLSRLRPVTLAHPHLLYHLLFRLDSLSTCLGRVHSGD
jgi:hypothetical protein